MFPKAVQVLKFWHEAPNVYEKLTPRRTLTVGPEPEKTKVSENTRSLTMPAPAGVNGEEADSVPCHWNLPITSEAKLRTPGIVTVPEYVSALDAPFLETDPLTECV